MANKNFNFKMTLIELFTFLLLKLFIIIEIEIDAFAFATSNWKGKKTSNKWLNPVSLLSNFSFLKFFIENILMKKLSHFFGKGNFPVYT